MALVITDKQGQSEVINFEEAIFSDEEGRFNDAAAFARYINDKEDQAVKYQTLKDMVEKINNTQEIAEKWAEQVSDIKKAAGIKVKEGDEEMFEQLEAHAKASRTTGDRIEQAKSVVRKLWPTESDVLFQNTPSTSTYWRALQAMATAAAGKHLSFKQALMVMNLSVLHRLTNPGRGVSNQLLVMTADIQAATKSIKGNVNLDHAKNRSTIQGYGYSLNAAGFICKAQDGVFSVPDDTGVEGGSEDDLPALGLGTQPAQIEGTETDDDNFEDLDDIADAADKDYEQGGPDFQAGLVVQELEDDDTVVEEEDEDSEPPTKRRQTTKGKGKAVVPKHKCGCDTTVPQSYLTQFKKGYRPTAIQHSAMVKTWTKYKKKTCYKHDCLILSSLGMKTKGVNRTEAKFLLNKFYEATINSTLGEMKTGMDSYAWFRRSHRPARVDDALGPYKYRHEELGAYRITEAQQMELCAYLKIDQAEWSKVGSINLDCFGWWETVKHEGVSIYDVTLQEFDMYDHHLRLIDNKPNYGWLRTMFHGLGQQAMRQDPMYFMMYSALRKDRNTDLVSYPYYAKFQHKGDATFFRHIDINILDLAKAGRGAYQIQGTTSLDNEFDDDCTEIVPGIYNNIDTWAKDLEGREGVKLSGLVNAINDKVFTAEDKKKYKTDWKGVPCKKLQVRISQPHIPHGAKGPAQRVRRTMLPWFVTVQADGNHLEILESGTWDDLAKAHRELNSAPRTPSGLSNRYGDIPYEFPAAVPLIGLGPLSDSLVCRFKPGNPLVLHAKRALIDGDKQFKDTYLAEWRKVATKAVVEAFKVEKQLEKDLFDKKSYFYMVEKNAEAVQADVMPEGEGEYQFNPHGVRDDAAKALAGYSSDSESAVSNGEAAEDEDMEDYNGDKGAAL